MNRAERDELARQAAAQAQVPPDWSGDKRLAVELAAAGLPDGVPAELDGHRADDIALASEPHCRCWYDERPCCRCGYDGDTETSCPAATVGLPDDGGA